MHTLFPVGILLHDILVAVCTRTLYGNVIAVVLQMSVDRSAGKRSRASELRIWAENSEVVDKIRQHNGSHSDIFRLERSSINWTVLGNFEGVDYAFGTEGVAAPCSNRIDERRVAYRTAEVLVDVGEVAKSSDVECIGQVKGD